jgi:hypothetical protein
MSRISRLVVFVTALASLFGVMSSTAGAVTWTNHGGTHFTATGGQGTLTSTGVIIQCTGADATGFAPMHGAVDPFVVSGSITFTGCLAAGSPATIDCSYALTARAVVQPIVTGDADFTCGVSISGTKLCHIEGSAHAQYTNEIGTLQTTTSTSLRVTGASCPVGSNDIGHLTPLDFHIPVVADRPTITRIA